jgi:hypothetical protein
VVDTRLQLTCAGPDEWLGGSNGESVFELSGANTSAPESRPGFETTESLMGNRF